MAESRSAERESARLSAFEQGQHLDGLPVVYIEPRRQPTIIKHPSCARPHPPPPLNRQRNTTTPPTLTNERPRHLLLNFHCNCNGRMYYNIKKRIKLMNIQYKDEFIDYMILHITELMIR